MTALLWTFIQYMLLLSTFSFSCSLYFVEFLSLYFYLNFRALCTLHRAAFVGLCTITKAFCKIKCYFIKVCNTNHACHIYVTSELGVCHVTFLLNSDSLSMLMVNKIIFEYEIMYDLLWADWRYQKSAMLIFSLSPTLLYLNVANSSLQDVLMSGSSLIWYITLLCPNNW